MNLGNRELSNIIHSPLVLFSVSFCCEVLFLHFYNLVTYSDTCLMTTWGSKYTLHVHLMIDIVIKLYYKAKLILVNDGQPRSHDCNKLKMLWFSHNHINFSAFVYNLNMNILLVTCCCDNIVNVMPMMTTWHRIMQLQASSCHIMSHYTLW